ncbi:MAG: efflux RND transporter periplasmic adaptor subunit [Gammaproteobacteria bacterium]|nr:efflux RND transporter periplasmic adaptor subunit [Gammaproteobacteria bacterium]
MIAAKLKPATILSSTILFAALGAVVAVIFLPQTHAKDSKLRVMPVEVTVIKERPVRIWKKFSGRLTAVDFVEIRPQASGLITDIRFKGGQLVNKKDILYVIDPRPYKVAVTKAKADLVTALNRHDLAEKEYKRAKDLIETKMISQRIYDERANARLVAESTANSARAQLSQAKINLNYAYVRAPVSGRISRTEVTTGNLVSAGPNAPLLTSIVSNENIYADFEVDEQTYLRYMQGHSFNESATHKIPVELRLQDNETVYKGEVYAFDNRIDPASGTIRARAIFDNPQGKLLPGMYARMRLGSPTRENRILLSERAIGTDQNRKFVYVVNGKNKTTYREVKLSDSIDGNRIIHSGLKIGDKVIVRGLIRIRPDMLVEPKVVQDTSETDNPVSRS